MARWLVVLLVLLALPARAEVTAVDVQLVLAVDVSRSMDEGEQRLQRAGYIAAFRDPQVLSAIEGGPLGRIAVTYVEWAGRGLQSVLVPWTIIDTAVDGERVATLLESRPLQRVRRTSITDALMFSAKLFETSGVTSRRRVIDVSGDGPNNQGFPVTEARDRLEADGITINGLPIMITGGYRGGYFSVPDLDLYYESCVIGGFGAFIVPVYHPSEFATAIRRKLILEIAGGTPVPRAIPVQWTDDAGRQIRDVDCQIGEKLLNEWLMDME